MAKKQEVAVKEETQVAVTTGGQAPVQQVLSSDLLIPKLLLMQGLSDFVSERKASQGDMVRSTTVEKLGDPDSPVEFIPLSYQNTWVLSELIGKKYEYRATEPMTAMNQNLPWEFTQNGVQWKRTKCMNLYALLPRDIEREQKAVELTAKTGELPDASIALMPVVISFRSTSYNAGKKVATHFSNVESLKRRYPAQYGGLVPWSSTLKLSCRMEKNDLGTFYVYDVENAGRTKQEFMQHAGGWADSLATISFKVDETGSEGGESVSNSNEY